MFPANFVDIEIDDADAGIAAVAEQAGDARCDHP